MPGAGRGIRRTAGSWLTPALLVLVVALGLPPDARAGDRTNLPLKNWGGFALHRDAAYDDLERLVTAGLADRTILNTKPLSRVEAARIVARAIERIRRDEEGKLNTRRDLEPVLDRLMAEFKPELAGLGVQIPDGGTAPGFFSFTPVDRAQVFAGYANQKLSLVNEQGSSFQSGANGGLTFESRLQIGDFLTLYVQPEMLLNEYYAAARLETGYVKLTLFNIELLFGRDSIAWGPSSRNPLLLSNNAKPLDQIRLGSAEPFELPWIGKWIGPMKALIFLAQLEESRDHPHAKLSGMRFTVSPASFLELGMSRVVMFNGDDDPKLPLRKYPEAIFVPSFGNDPAHPEERTNNLFSVDAELRFRNLDRYFFPSRDLRLYGEFYWDDTCGECGPSSGIGHFLASNFLPAGSTVGGSGGVQFFGLFGQDWLDARFEYSQTSRQSYNHSEFTSGYWTRGHVIGDFIGTDGRDIVSRVTARLTPNLMLGFQAERATIGSTVNDFQGPQEKRLGGGIDVSWRFWKRYSLFAQYVVGHVENRRFVRGDDGFDHLVRLELTRSFR